MPPFARPRNGPRLSRRDAAARHLQIGPLLQHVRPQILLDEDHGGHSQNGTARRAGSDRAGKGVMDKAYRPVRKREIVAWALCDWANSAYSTLLITILVSYLQGFVLQGDAGI